MSRALLHLTLSRELVAGTAIVIVRLPLPIGNTLSLLYPDPPLKRKGGSGEYSTASHYEPLKLLAELQQIGGVLSRSVKV